MPTAPPSPSRPPPPTLSTTTLHLDLHANGDAHHHHPLRLDYYGNSSDINCRHPLAQPPPPSTLPATAVRPAHPFLSSYTAQCVSLPHALLSPAGKHSHPSFLFCFIYIQNIDLLRREFPLACVTRQLSTVVKTLLFIQSVLISRFLSILICMYCYVTLVFIYHLKHPHLLP